MRKLDHRAVGLRDAATLLAAWEFGAETPELARGAAVLDIVGVETVGQELLPGESSAIDLPIQTLAGLAVRCLIDAFGDTVESVIRCDGCGLTLEIDLSLQMLVDGPAERPTDDRCAAQESVMIASSPGPIAIRAPSTRDLLAAAGRRDAREVILCRCGRHPDGRTLDPHALTVDDLAAIDAALESLAGAAFPTIGTQCPGCGRTVTGVIDAGALLWERVRTAAPAVLADVAALAGAYGWSESDVLALSPSRRSAYLRLAGR